jgi:hypothetical protein
MDMFRRLWLLLATVVTLAIPIWAQSPSQSDDFKGKVVVAGSGVQVEKAIDVLVDTLEKGGVAYRVVSGDASRRAENEKLAANGAVSLLYVNSDIVPRQRPKLTVECYDPEGKMLWSEDTSLTFQKGATNDARRMAERISEKLAKSRIGGPGLPKK